MTENKFRRVADGKSAGLQCKKAVGLRLGDNSHKSPPNNLVFCIVIGCPATGRNSIAHVNNFLLSKLLITTLLGRFMDLVHLVE